jgi:hypothetical protein
MVTLKGRQFDDIMITEILQTALAEFKTGFLQMLPTAIQSLDSLHQVAMNYIQGDSMEYRVYAVITERKPNPEITSSHRTIYNNGLERMYM